MGQVLVHVGRRNVDPSPHERHYAHREALAEYKDYRVAMEEEFAPLHPERKPLHYHFVNKQHRIMVRLRFDPAEPTALLYKKTEHGYELEGAMYHSSKGTNEGELNERVPLSVAQWHAHIPICFSPCFMR